MNPSGGLESKGHPVGATGLAQVFEIVAQLRGEALARQAPEARVGVAENGGGFWGVEEGDLCRVCDDALGESTASARRSVSPAP